MEFEQNGENKETQKAESSNKYFWRQILISSGPWTSYFGEGLFEGTPTVMVPQLKRENYAISDDQTSWLPSTISFSGIPWALVLSYLCFAIGPKKCHIVICISTIIGIITFYCSTSVIIFIIGEVFEGATVAGCITTFILIVTEYTSSNYRGMCLTIKSASFFWGLLVANTIGTFFHWSNIPVLALVCTLLNLISTSFWTESPYWLAQKGRLEECTAAHRWLKGDGKNAEMELEKLLNTCANLEPLENNWALQNIWKMISQKNFVKPIGLCCLLLSLYCFSGKMVCAVYSIEILKRITKSEANAYSGMLILDSLTVITMYLGCFICRLLKRRLMLFLFSILGITFLILLSGFLYLVKLSVLEDNNYVSIALLAGYSISMSCGPMILTTSIVGELLPLSSRSLSMCVICLFFKFILGTFYKISPLCFSTLAVHGTFMLFAVLSSIILIIIYFCLPETKDKTLYEINELLKL